MSARTEELSPGLPHKAKPEKSSNGDGVAKAESEVRIEIRTSTCFRVAKINANFSAKILSGIRIRCALRVEIAAASRGRNCSCFPLTKAVRRLLKRKKKKKIVAALFTGLQETTDWFEIRDVVHVCASRPGCRFFLQPVPRQNFYPADPHVHTSAGRRPTEQRCRVFHLRVE